MQPDLSTSALMECAAEATRMATRHALDNLDRRDAVIQRTPHDVKLQLDVECQRKAEQFIQARYPDHAVLGEEDDSNAVGGGRPGYEWIIDPIDGTVNFSHGMHRWCCSIAVRHGDTVLAGAVFAPQLGELYTASVDEPSRCNGEPIHVSNTADLAGAVIYTGLDKNVDPRLPPFEIFRTLASNVQKTRILGAAAIDICQVAAGRGDAYFESGIYLWDIAAAGLIIRRAGGATRTMGRQGGYRLWYLAGNGRINAAVAELIETVPTQVPE